MTLGIVKFLVKVGALPPLQPGPSRPKSAEEAKQRKYELQRAAVKRRKELILAAREKGEPDPVFKKGRPRKYTPEEAKAVKHFKDAGSMTGYNERIRVGLKILEAMYDTKNA
jgi:hypothetical protein